MLILLCFSSMVCAVFDLLAHFAILLGILALLAILPERKKGRKETEAPEKKEFPAVIKKQQKEATLTNPDEYESNALKEIEKWKNREPGLVERSLDLLAKPVDWVYQEIPEEARKVVEEAIEGALELLKDAAYWTFSEEDILKEARSLGLNVSNCRELSGFRLYQLDPLARRYFTSNQLIASLEGGGCGLGGAVLLAADIPALFTVSFRAIQQIGSCYGFDMRDPNMLPVVMGIVGVASSRTVAGKTQLLADMHLVAKLLAKNVTYEQVAERTIMGSVVKILRQWTKTVPKEIAKNLSKRKLAQLIPLAGAIVGAGLNYWFVGTACEAAYMTFREMHLKFHSGRRVTLIQR